MNRSTDPWLILTVALLVVFGMVMVYSASAVVALDGNGGEARYLTRQLVAAVVGMGLCVGTAITPIRIIRRYRVALLVAVVLGLVLCYVPGIRNEAKGASRWIGFGGINVQPSEFAKIVVLLMMAHFLDKRRGLVHDHRVVLRSLLIPLPILLLILGQPDFGTTVIIAGLCGIMLIIAGMRLSHVGVAAGVGLAVTIPVIQSQPYRLARIASFMDPWGTADKEGYHTIQSWVAMHSGGLTGQGLGASMAKLHFLPEPWTDYISAVIAEELGLVALIGLITLYIILVWRGLAIAHRARDAFSMYLAATLSIMVGIEAFLNLAVVMGIVPPKGLVLPFISYGASAMMSHLWIVGILLSIAAESQDEPVTAGWPTAPAAATPAQGAA
jgi:cell division protein FtsW